MTRFNGSKRVKVGMNDANSSTGIQASTSTTAASFTGSVFGSMGRKVESHPVPLTAGQIASEEKRRSKEEKRVSKEKEQEKRNRERKRMEGKLLKGDTEASKLAKKYREQVSVVRRGKRSVAREAQCGGRAKRAAEIVGWGRKWGSRSDSRVLQRKAHLAVLLLIPIGHRSSSLPSPQKIPKDCFVDPGIEYMGETILHWSIRDFVGNKESWDELRKKARRMGIVKKGLKRKVDKDWAEKLCRN